MKRCDVCDSTEIIDTVADLGINEPILYWSLNLDGSHRCNRCEEDVQENLNELGGSDE